jgi:hypothetical protein
MRLWTLHPRYLDSKGLVAAWREALLAQKVLAGGTKGYRHHPQLYRFQTQPEPRAAIATFLHALAEEAGCRGYNFDRTKIACAAARVRIPETKGQLLFEWQHLQSKLAARAPALAERWRAVSAPEPNPLFRIFAGGVRGWEKDVSGSRSRPPP